MNRDYWQLRTAARNYYDAYKLKIRVSNRLRALMRAGEAYDIDLHAQLKAIEEMTVTSQKILTRVYRNMAPPAILAFQRETLGLGEVWMARLIGEVGDFVSYTEAWWVDPADVDPALLGGTRRYNAALEDGAGPFEDDESSMPRRVLAIGDVLTSGVREVYAYCGHGDASLRRRRGQSQDEALASGNPTAKMIAHQMAEFALRLNGKPDKNGKARGMTPYYPCYEAARAHAEAEHPDWKKGHAYQHAVRIVAKAILKDIWRVQHGFAPIYGAPQPEWRPRGPKVRRPRKALAYA